MRLKFLYIYLLVLFILGHVVVQVAINLYFIFLLFTLAFSIHHLMAETILIQNQKVNDQIDT